ncbi:unnamed protein product [Microthlaspi erraticum]|uniref:F-box domain-containing protein n=1 Tax=Microthlaspi erraticum TaxID=1685480 RepID=A0A6D2LFS5_9BRAS|nr:unnamed protein product [Microthlaspi erraticum]
MAMARKTQILGEMVTEIQARLPLKSIARFKSVCKTWKSTLESAYFRRLFLSLHQNSSSSWSLMSSGAVELIGFHGCETWGLPKSPASFIPPSFKRYYLGDFDHVSSSCGFVLIADSTDDGGDCYVGNPVSQEWVKIPALEGDSTVFDLVTRLDEGGVVVGFKVMRLASVKATNNYLSATLSFSVYSSETGIWTSKIIHCPHQITNLFSITLNGTIYFTCLSVPGVMASHDFYSESDQFRVVQLPDHSDPVNAFKRALVTSSGSVLYVRVLPQKEETFFKIWRLNNGSGDDDQSWQILWEIGLPVIGDCAPLAMHPFDVATVYLWSQQDHHLVSCNLRTRKITVLMDADNDGRIASLTSLFVSRTWISCGIEDHHRQIGTIEFQSGYSRSCSHVGWNRCLVLPKLR